MMTELLTMIYPVIIILNKELDLNAPIHNFSLSELAICEVEQNNSESTPFIYIPLFGPLMIHGIRSCFEIQKPERAMGGPIAISKTPQARAKTTTSWNLS